ncbi:hypothetical protein YC2023_018235 [Brassica napus]
MLNQSHPKSKPTDPPHICYRRDWVVHEVKSSNVQLNRFEERRSGGQAADCAKQSVTSQEAGKLSFAFFTRGGKYVECLLCVSKKLDREGVVSLLFPATCQPRAATSPPSNCDEEIKGSAYIERQIRNPLSSIMFTQRMMEGSQLRPEQRRILQTSALCQKQLNNDYSDLNNAVYLYNIVYCIGESEVGQTLLETLG